MTTICRPIHVIVGGATGRPRVLGAVATASLRATEGVGGCKTREGKESSQAGREGGRRGEGERGGGGGGRGGER